MEIIIRYSELTNPVKEGPEVIPIKGPPSYLQLNTIECYLQLTFKDDIPSHVNHEMKHLHLLEALDCLVVSPGRLSRLREVVQRTNLSS